MLQWNRWISMIVKNTADVFVLVVYALIVVDACSIISMFSFAYCLHINHMEQPVLIPRVLLTGLHHLIWCYFSPCFRYVCLHVFLVLHLFVMISWIFRSVFSSWFWMIYQQMPRGPCKAWLRWWPVQHTTTCSLNPFQSFWYPTGLTPQTFWACTDWFFSSLFISFLLWRHTVD